MTGVGVKESQGNLRSLVWQWSLSGAADRHLRQGKEEKAQLIKKPNQFNN